MYNMQMQSNGPLADDRGTSSLTCPEVGVERAHDRDQDTQAKQEMAPVCMLVTEVAFCQLLPLLQGGNKAKVRQGGSGTDLSAYRCSLGPPQQ